LLKLHRQTTVNVLAKELGKNKGLAQLPTMGLSAELVVDLEEARYVALADLPGTFHVPIWNHWKLGRRALVNCEVKSPPRWAPSWEATESLGKLLDGEDNIVDIIDWCSQIPESDRRLALAFNGIDLPRGGGTGQARETESMATAILSFLSRKTA